MSLFIAVSNDWFEEVVMRLKELLLQLLPTSIRVALRRFRAKLVARGYRGSSPEEVFSKIYQRGAWGTSGDAAQPFYSGTGSHDAATVDAYVAAVTAFLRTFNEKPTVVDVGCGDFNVGSQLRSFCSKYVAVDVVPALIDYNRTRFATSNVDFQVLDVTTERPPMVDVIFVRQVFQHLSNEQIRRALSNLSDCCRYLVVTEHLPEHAGFAANLDKPAGPDIRGYIESGVVLTLSPFSLSARSVRELCRARDADGFIVTSVYEI